MGESLSERARVNRLLKYADLEGRDKSELLLACDGSWTYEVLVMNLKLYSSYFGDPRTVQDGHGPTSAGRGFQHHMSEGHAADEEELSTVEETRRVPVETVQREGDHGELEIVHSRREAPGVRALHSRREQASACRDRFA